MPIMRHKFGGVMPAGDEFLFSWVSNTLNGLTTSHENAVDWITNLWNGVDTADGISGLYPASTVLQKCTTNQIFENNGRTQMTMESDLVGLIGTGTGNPLPQDTAIVVSFRTQFAGASYRGRMYLPGPVVANLTAIGELAGAAITTIMESLTAAWVVADGAGEVPSVYSHSLSDINAITTFGVGTVFDRQKRRVNKVATTRTFAVMP